MKYTYPTGFSLARAQELGNLVNNAYNQLTQGTAWQAPAGYTLQGPGLFTKEFWKLPGPVSEMLEHLLPEVLFGFVATKGSDIFVVIRGTKTPLEWLDDFAAQPVAFQPHGQDWGSTTRGYARLYAYLGAQIGTQLAECQTKGNNLSSIFVTGHSLGAALAHLVAAGITAQFGVRSVSYTFSGPRAGDSKFAQAFASTGLETWRVFNTEDIVPTVPPAAVRMATPNMGMHGMSMMTQTLSNFVLLSPTGYQHVGYPVAATFHRDVVADNHSLVDLCAEIALP